MSDTPSTTTFETLNPFAEEWREDPYPLYERLRAMGDAVWVDDGFWVIPTHDAVGDALKDFERLVSGNPKLARDGEPMGPAFSAFTELLVKLDPPEHRPIRNLMATPFRPASVGALQSTVTQVVDELISSVEGSGSCDIAKEFAWEMPMLVITRLLGFPAEDRRLFREWTDAFVRIATRGITSATVARADAAMVEFLDYVGALADKRSADPGDDFLSVLLAAEEEGEVLSRRQLVVQTALLLMGGHETTSNAFCNGLQAFFQDPDQWELLKDRPELTADAVEEILRYDPPAQNATRMVNEDMEFHGADFRRGQDVVVLLASANRDATVFDEPDRFDIQREKSNHHAFGFGRHFCLGAALSRMELSEAFRVVAARLPDLRPAGEPVPYRTGLVRGYESLPVEF